MSGTHGIRRRAMAGTWLLLAAPLGVWLLRGILAPLPATRVQIEEPFSHGLVSDAARVEVRGFLATPRGFALTPQGGGEIQYRVLTPHPLTRWSALTLQWYGGAPGIRSTVDLLGPDGPQRLVQNRSMPGTRLTLPASVAGQTEITLQFSAWNPTNQERLLLDKLVLQAWDEPPRSLPDAGWVGAIFLAIALGVAGLTARPGQTALVGSMLTLALTLRHANLLRVALAPLDPDAQAYRAYATLLTWSGPHGFYSAGFGIREPLYPAVARLALWVLGDSDLSLRLLSLLLSVGVVYAGYRLGRELLGVGCGLGAGFLLAMAVPAIIESGRGLRVELETLLLVGFAWLLLGGRGSLSGSRAALAGVVGGALLLTRFAYTPGLALLLAVSAWWHRGMGERRWRSLMVAAAIGFVLVLPHRLALAIRYGDVAYDAHRILQWIVNQEFQGQAGFPSPVELIRDPFAGPQITLGHYYLGLHTPWELIWRSLRGLGKALFNLSLVGYVEEVQAVLGLPLGWVDFLVTAAGVIGLGVLVGRRDAGWVPLVLLVGLAHVAFVYDLGLPDYRFRMILQALPLFAVAVVAGSRWLTGGILAMFPGVPHRSATGGSLSTPASPERYS